MCDSNPFSGAARWAAGRKRCVPVSKSEVAAGPVSKKLKCPSSQEEEVCSNPEDLAQVQSSVREIEARLDSQEAAQQQHTELMAMLQSLQCVQGINYWPNETSLANHKNLFYHTLVMRNWFAPRREETFV